MSKVTPIQINNPVKFSVWCNSGIGLTAATATKVPLTTKNFDTGTNFDATTNYRFTVPITGFYFITTQVQIGVSGISSTASALSYVFKNGVEARRSQASQGSGSATTIIQPVITDLYSLVAGDYIELYAQCSEASRNIGPGSNITYMSGFLVSVL